MKKQYCQPSSKMIIIEAAQLLAGSVKGIESGETGIKYGGAGSGNARSREGGDWDEE